jgi:hypothetical protein
MTAPTDVIAPNPNSASYASAVTKSDSTVLTATRGLWVGGAGNVTVTMAGENPQGAVTFVGVAAGTLLPISVVKVMDTNTTATDMLALW